MSNILLNNYKTTLVNPIGAADTQINVGLSLPALGVGDYYLLTLFARSGAEEYNWEIVKVTAAGGSTLTVTRGQEGTAARVWGADTLVEMRLTAGQVSSKTDLGHTHTIADVTNLQTALDGKEPTITTLPVNKGGTGASTLTGLVKGNGTGAMTAAVADTDYVTPSGTSTLDNKTVKGVFIDKTTTNATATGTVTLNLATADVFNLTLSGNTTVALSNIPTLSNETFAFVVRVSQGGTAYTLTWFSGITWLTTGGTAPAAPAASKSVEYIFSTTDGTNWTGRKGAAN